MDKLTIDANLLDAQGKPMDLLLARMDADIQRLFLEGSLATYNSFAQLGISNNEATVALIASRLPNNCIFMTEVIRSTHINFDSPRLTNGASLSGRLTVWASVEVTNKVTFNFQNEYGLWIRHINRLAGEHYIDSGWLRVMQHGLIEFMTASSATNNGNLLSNIKTPGRYYLSGAMMNAFTDTPTTGSGASVLDVEYLLDLDDTIQTLRTNGVSQTGWRRHISNNGTVGAWVQEFVSGVNLNTTASINFAGGTISGTLTTRTLTPNVTATHNIGYASAAYNQAYFQNAPTVVSDENHKVFIDEIPDEVLDAWSTVNYKQWKMKKAVSEKGENEARLHIGVIAQDIRDKFLAAGLDACDYGILIHDTWDADESKEAGEIWMVRMEECLALEAALMRRTIRRLEAKLIDQQ